MIYLDNAATTGKKPQAVINAVGRALSNLSANPGRSGHKMAARAADAVYTVRQKTAEMFGAEGAEQVIFTSGCTHSINCVLKGTLEKNDHIIVSELEHNAVMRPITKMGLQYDMAEVSLTDDNLTVENFSRLIKPNTRMIFCTAGSNVTGRALPLERLGALCRVRGLLFGVDAAQTAGVMPLDMQRMNIDFLCIAPHKGLYAPMGVGILIARKPLGDTIIEGGTGTGSANLEQGSDMPEDYESGTVNLPGIVGTGAGIDFVRLRGIENIYKHEIRLLGRLYDGLVKLPGTVLYTPRPEAGAFAPVLSFNIEGMPSFEAAKLLNNQDIAVRAGLHCAPMAHRALGTLKTGTVRICPSVFTTEQEINYTLRAIKNIKKFKKL